MKTITFSCKKIVRDNIEQTLSASKISSEMHVMSTEEAIPALKTKLIEEAHEVVAATSHNEHIDELADVCELIDYLKKLLAISDKELAAAQEKKRTHYGAYDKLLWLEKMEMATDDKQVNRFASRPEKYPLIKKDK